MATVRQTGLGATRPLIKRGRAQLVVLVSLPTLSRFRGRPARSEQSEEVGIQRRLADGSRCDEVGASGGSGAHNHGDLSAAVEVEGS